jgi:hypothetical protein
MDSQLPVIAKWEYIEKLYKQKKKPHDPYAVQAG